ncbi:gamma-glutamyltransferase [Roseomonas eburnea]|uniref:Glutathione hydrolase proenzyme n=1 Tax=Neoroseomonas eburnea TaxID=1346889 RepID=A0A9X9XJX7_9PROT|nr:gamma-glutamyltransferase [Neoroseomonas eburnea]MBR0684013.1 gamma-glutamyltransferase [Neoroseomonas eburnea]
MTSDWTTRAGTRFTCDKRPATGTKGMVVTNHPLASAAGAEMLAAGGNAVDAAIAALFALTVVEPMMVGLLGGGTAHLRLPDGTHTIIDGMATCAAAARPDMFTPAQPENPRFLEAVGRVNVVGGLSVATPGNLKAWCEILERFGSVPLADVMAPAIRHAERGYRATPYLAECAREAAPDMAKDPAIAAIYLPDGAPLKPGHRVVQSDYAETLKTIAREGAAALSGALGQAVADGIARAGGIVSAADIAGYRTVERTPLRGPYRDVEIVLPPPPASSGVHVLQMLNILSGYDLRAMGFGSADTAHLLAECLKIAFADRAAASGDPDFVQVPVERLISAAYGDERRAMLDMARAQDWSAGIPAAESPNTTHITVADAEGRIACMTQTINSTFGARFIVHGTGMIPNNYLATFDPRPGKALSIAPGKRVTTSMSPMIVLRGGQPAYALGMPGGLRIFGSVMQGMLNLVDHGMSLQEAVEAPRLWTQGEAVEMEPAFGEDVRSELAARGHRIARMPHVGGGMCAIGFHPDGTMEGAACWRADGTAIGVGGGLAREGVRFWPDQAGPR